MPGHHFISYSSVDGRDFAVRLRDALASGSEPVRTWYDKDLGNLRPGIPWDRQLDEAVRSCATLLFVMTSESVEDTSVCKNEWTAALKYKKPVIPLLVGAKAEMPFRLAPRQHVDFTASFDAGITVLREHLQWLETPDGVLTILQDRLADAERDLRRADNEQDRLRITAERLQLKEEIEERRRAIADPIAAQARTKDSIRRGLERERQPRREGSGPRTPTVHDPPLQTPSHFQNRFIESKLIGAFLRDESKVVLTVAGRGGTGKTVLVTRLLLCVEKGELPDDGGELRVDGIVYLTSKGDEMQALSFAHLYAGLCKLLPADLARDLEATGRATALSVRTKMQALLKACGRRHLLVLLDNLEDVIDPETHKVRDRDLADAVTAVLEATAHRVNLLITTRIVPQDLALVQPGRQTPPVRLDEGLGSPHAENILREMDVDGTVGLKNGTPELLAQARERTLGYPRALEALFGILSADRYTTLADLVTSADRPLPDNVVEVLVGEAFNRLDPLLERTMQALALYGRPVSAAAIEHLLLPHVVGFRADACLRRLVNMHFVRRQGRDHFTLHPVDRDYAFSRIPEGSESDRTADPAPFTRYALFHRAASFYEQARRPPEAWTSVEDVSAQLAEFELRCEGKEYDTAALLVLELNHRLENWGHFQLKRDMYERCVAQIADRGVQLNALGMLGWTLYRLNRLSEAIERFQAAIRLLPTIAGATEQQLAASCSAWLTGIASCLGDLGRTQESLEFYEQAATLARVGDDAIGLATVMNNVGFFAADLGDTERAIRCHQEALAIEATDTERYIYAANLGAREADRGLFSEARARCTQALEDARTDGNRYAQSVALTYLGDIACDLGDWDGSIVHFEQARRIAHEIGNAQFGVMALSGLALAYLHLGQMRQARAWIDEARTLEVPRSKYQVLSLHALIALHEGDLAAARAGFSATLVETARIIQGSPRHGRALDAQAFARCGLVACGEGGLNDAVQAYADARAVNAEPGVAARAVRLVDRLAGLAPAAGLELARGAAAGV